MDPDQRNKERLADLAAFSSVDVGEHARAKLGSLVDDPWIRAEYERRVAHGWTPVDAVDDLAHHTGARLFELMLERIGPEGSILDFGCGQGSLVNFGRDYTSVSNPIVAVDQAAPKEPFPAHVRFERSDLHAWEWRGEPFDLALSMHVFEQLPDTPRLASKLHGLIRPGGYALLAFPDTRWLHSVLKFLWKGERYDEVQTYTFESFDQVLQGAGFERLAWAAWPSHFSIHYGHVPLPGGRNLGELLDQVAAHMDRANGTQVHTSYGHLIAYRAC